MILFKLLIIVSLAFLVALVYNKYSPKIDIIKSVNKYIILLWYNKKYYNGEYKRVYVKILEL